jgi:hypothetical protein
MRFNPRLLLYIALALAVLNSIAKYADPPQQIPLVRSDWPVCIKLNPNGPLTAPKETIHGKGHPELT